MHETLLVFFLIISIMLVALIIMQKDKIIDMKSSYKGASSTLFGSSGSNNFITRATAILAALFFSISLALSNINNNTIDKKNKEWDHLNISNKVEKSSVKK